MHHHYPPVLLQLPTLVGAAVVLDHSGASVRILAAYCRLSGGESFDVRGVAKVIKARTPLCTGDHYPLRPHHFSHIQAVPPPLQPRQHLPARAGTCLPCNAPLPTATNGRASPLPPSLNRNAGLAADHESD